MANTQDGEYHGSYDHLNSSDNNNLEIKIDMDELAEMIVRLNRGVVRLLAAIVRARVKQYNKNDWGHDELSAGIIALLDKTDY